MKTEVARFIERLREATLKRPVYHNYSLDLAHTPYGEYLVDSCTYSSSVSRRSGIFDVCFEPAISVVLRALAQTSETFVDIGANIGYHAISLSSAVDSVYAIEPSAPLFDLLTLNIQLAERNNIHPFRYALADVDDMHVDGDNPVYTHAQDHFLTTTFDSFVRQQPLQGRPYLIKIDVDGYEAKVLYGMRQFLEQNADATTLMLEVTPHNIQKYGDAPEQFYDFLDRFGFEYYVIEEGKVSHTGSDLRGVYLNGEQVARLRRVDSLRQIVGKEANYILTRQPLVSMTVDTPFLEKKAQLLSWIDTLVEPDAPTIESLSGQIHALGNPIFDDQWERFTCIAWEQQSPITFDEDLALLEFFPAYQLRRAWTRFYRDDSAGARTLFLQITEQQPSPFFLIKAASGLCRLKANRDCRRVLEQLTENALLAFDDAASPEIRAAAGRPADYLEALRLLYRFELKELTAQLGRALIRHAANEHLVKAILQCAVDFGDLDLANAAPMRLDEGSLFDVPLSSRWQKLKTFLHQFAFMRSVRGRLSRDIQISIAANSKPLTGQARNFDPLQVHRKNRQYNLLFGAGDE